MSSTAGHIEPLPWVWLPEYADDSHPQCCMNVCPGTPKQGCEIESNLGALLSGFITTDHCDRFSHTNNKFVLKENDSKAERIFRKNQIDLFKNKTSNGILYCSDAL